MEIAAVLIDFILHVDVHLAHFVQAYGAWVYALLFVIVFIETGLVVMPFLPGDSLLFVVGAMAGAEVLSLPLVLAWPAGIACIAAIGSGTARLIPASHNPYGARPRNRA